MIFRGKYGARSKIIMKEEIIDYISSIKYLGCQILLHNAQKDINKVKS
jgi:hypothetical protein